MPRAAGGKRDPGVYLHWAPPDALLRGTLQGVPNGSDNRLGMPPLPDRWVVIRILAPQQRRRAGFAPVYPCHVPPRDMRQHPIGTGPFKFVEFKPNEYTLWLTGSWHSCLW